MSHAHETAHGLHCTTHPLAATATFFERTWYGLGRTIVGLYAGLLFGTNIRYQAPIPAGAKILAANHPSTVDPILITTLVPEQVSVLINEVLFKVPVVGASLRFSGHIPVAHHSGLPAFEAARRYLQSGRTLGIFPEGAISAPVGVPQRSRTGAARLALCAGVPIIPIGIALDPGRIHRIETRVDGILEVGTWYLHGPYAVTVGEPMVFEGDVEDHAYVRAASEAVMGRIAALRHDASQRLPACQTKTHGALRRILALAGRPALDA